MNSNHYALWKNLACVQAHGPEAIAGLQGRPCILYLLRSHTQHSDWLVAVGLYNYRISRWNQTIYLLQRFSISLKLNRHGLFRYKMEQDKLFVLILQGMFCSYLSIKWLNLYCCVSLNGFMNARDCDVHQNVCLVLLGRAVENVPNKTFTKILKD